MKENACLSPENDAMQISWKIYLVLLQIPDLARIRLAPYEIPWAAEDPTLLTAPVLETTGEARYGRLFAESSVVGPLRERLQTKHGSSDGVELASQSQ